MVSRNIVKYLIVTFILNQARENSYGFEIELVVSRILVFVVSGD